MSVPLNIQLIFSSTALRQLSEAKNYSCSGRMWE